MTNSANALFAVSTDGDIAGATLPGDGILDNLGTFRRLTSAGTVNVRSLFNNRAGALVDVQTGTLNLANPGTIAGTFNVAGPATLAFSGTQTIPSSASFTGLGTLAFTGGTTTFGSGLSFPNIALSGGTILGSGNLTVSNLTLGGITLGRDLAINGTTSTGSVLVTGAGSAFGSANVTVAAGGILR